MIKMQGWLRHTRWKGKRRWRAHFPGKRCFSASNLRVLMLSELNPISQSQIFPFHFYERELFSRWQHSLCEVPTAEFEADPEATPGGADVVAVQTWFDLTAQRCERLFAAIRLRNPNAKVVFLDSFAPTDLRLAKMLDPHIDIYVKKHVYRDRSRHLALTHGETNLAAYYCERYGIASTVVDYEVPPNFLRKMVLGPSFVTSPVLLPTYYDNTTHCGRTPRFDVHARLATSGGGWYGRMRQEAIDNVERLQDREVLSRTGASNYRYMRELRHSRICFSPFGYGEVCWRDYEAILSGALLMKPEMGHIETDPDIFVPHETYVPLAWDLSDFKERVDWYLSNESARATIARRAYDRLHRYAHSSEFVEQMAALFQK